MRGIAQIVPPSAIQRRLDRIRARTAPPEIVAAKLHAQKGEYRQALELLIKVGGAEPEHMEGFNRWCMQQPAAQAQSIEEFV